MSHKKTITLIPYTFALFVCFIIYGFSLTNFSVIPDSEVPVYPGYSLHLGRWGINLIRYHLFHGFLPYYTFLLGLFFLSMASVEMTKLLQLKGVYRYLFIILFLSFPQHAYQFAFTMQSDAISIGYFLSTLAVNLFIGIKSMRSYQSILKILFIIVLLSFTMAIYQALAMIPVILYALYFFTKIESNTDNLTKEWNRLFGFIGILSLSAIIYIISIKLFFYDLDSSYLSSYTSSSEQTIFERLYNFIRIILHNLLGNFYYGDTPYFLATIGFSISIILFIISKKNTTLKILIFLFIISFPFSISLFISNGYHPPRLYVASTISFAFILVYITKKVYFINFKSILFFVTIIFLWNTYYVNSLFFASNRIYHKDLNLATNIYNRIVNECDDFEPTKDYVYFYGAMPAQNYNGMILPKSEIFSGSTFRWDEGSNWRIINFFRATDIASFRYLDDKKIINTLTDTIHNMKIYPHKNSIRKIGNVVTVKLGHYDLIDKNKLSSTDITHNPIKIKKLHHSIQHNKNISGFVEKLDKTGKEIKISGWATYDSIPSKNVYVSILFFNKKNVFEVTTNKTYRFDVTNYLGGRINHNSSGFRSKINIDSIPKGKYKIGIRVIDSVSNRDNYKLSPKTLLIN